MNKLAIIRNNLLAKGVLDAQLSALLIQLETEYAELVEAKNELELVKIKVNDLEDAVNKLNALHASTPVEDGANDINNDLNTDNESKAEVADTVEADETNETKRGFDFSKLN